MQKKYKDDFIKAGKIAKEVRAFGKALIVNGASYNAIVRQINAKIKELGAINAFPPQLALNNVAAHFLPMPSEDIIFNDELIKLDIGVCFEGAIGDCAVTVDLSGKYQGLIDAVESALLYAEKSIRVGMKTCEIGQIIEERINFYGYTPVKNLCGHGLGCYKVHMEPSIPNYNDRSQKVIKPGMTFAIEPFATDGKGYIYDAGNPTIFSLKRPKPTPHRIAKKILDKIKSMPALPFALHDVVEGIPLHEAIEGIDVLMHSGIIEGYAPLIEEANGFVAQAENSILVDEDGHVFVTTR